MDIQELRQRVFVAARTGALAEAITDVELEPACDEDGEEFIRVKLFVRLPDRNIDNELEATLERIEETVAAFDDRYASVRFLDAA